MMVDERAPYAPTYRDELALVKHFVTVLEERLAGRDFRRRAIGNPLNWCYLGILGAEKGDRTPVELEVEQPEVAASAADSMQQSQSPVPPPKEASAAAASPSENLDADADALDGDPPPVAPVKAEDRLGTRRPPSALGFEILLEPDAQGFVELSVDVSFCVFTKHLPTLKEQGSVLDIGAAEGAPLVDVVQRWPIEVKGIRFRLQPNGRRSFDDEGLVQQALDKVLEAAFAKPDADRIWPYGGRPKVENQELLKDASAFGAFVSSEAHGLPVERWSISGSVEIRTSPRPDGLVRIGCYVRNKTPETAMTEKNRGLKDAFLTMADARVCAKVLAGGLRPVEILPVPQDYQYDRRVWAVGHNTSVVSDVANLEVRTAALAQYDQV